MELINLSSEPLGKLHSWIPHGLRADKIVFLPDACPGRSPLPTGTAVRTRQVDWRRFAVSDCGCGMRLLRSELGTADVTIEDWDLLADRLRSNKGHSGTWAAGITSSCPGTVQGRSSSLPDPYRVEERVGARRPPCRKPWSIRP